MIKLSYRWQNCGIFYFLLFLKTAGCWDLFSSHPSVSPFYFLIMPAFAEGENKWLGLDISSAVEFQRQWIIKSKSFGQESTYSKDFFKNLSMNYVHQKLTLELPFWHFLTNHNSLTDLKKNPLSMFILGQNSCFKI